MYQCISFFIIFLFQLFFYPGDQFGKFRGHDRFQDIITHPKSNCLFCILKFLISTDDHTDHIGILLFCFFHKLQSVHYRHLDICDQNIRFSFFLYQLQCFFTVIGSSHNLELVVFLFYNVDDQTGGHRLIINNHHLIHRLRPPFPILL